MRLVVIFLLSFLLFVPSVLQAASDELGYDKYGADEESQTIIVPSSSKKILDSPAIAVQVVKKTIRKAVVWMEDIKLYDKSIKVYEEFIDRGIYPVKTDIGDRRADPPGVEFNYGIYSTPRTTSSGTFNYPVGIQYLKEFDVSDIGISKTAEVNGWTKIGFNRYKEYGTQLTFEDFIFDGAYFKNTFRYRDLPREDFFGIGNNISIADGYAFNLEEYSFATALGCQLPFDITGEIGAIFSIIDVNDGKNNKKRPISANMGLEGRTGAKLAALGFSLERDDRDDPDNPKRGGYQRFKLGWYEGVDGDDFGYMKYRMDFAQYLPVGEYFDFLYWDSVLAVRLSGEMNNDINDDNIPFFDLARVGGGESVRAYQYNRFFDENNLFGSIEYRYNIWTMRQYKVDATVFFDAGWIFNESSDFEFDQIKEGYGLGLRLVLPSFTMAFEGAHGDEGTEFYVTVNPIL